MNVVNVAMVAFTIGVCFGWAAGLLCSYRWFSKLGLHRHRSGPGSGGDVLEYPPCPYELSDEPAPEDWVAPGAPGAIVSKQPKPVKTLPPPEIFDVLHAAECAGVVLPEVVDEWWARETDLRYE